MDKQTCLKAWDSSAKRSPKEKEKKKEKEEKEKVENYLLTSNKVKLFSPRQTS